jgi:2-polyprenyl-6-methoxyphenol hydroxylase-like FAD-dependent oxidoreductase
MVTDPQAAPFSVAIIEGGLAGLTLSIGLTRSEYRTGSTRLFSEIGVGIAMSPNSVWALALIDPRLRESYDRCMTYNECEGQREVHYYQVCRILVEFSS